MRLVAVDPLHPEPGIIAHAAALLRAGGLVAFPTETVYGLGGDALDPEAVARIYAAKGRPAWNPVIAHVASVSEARALAAGWPDVAERAAAAFWPGPLTLVVRKAAGVPDVTTAGLDRIAIRVPAHPVALALVREAGRPIAAPSANRFTAVSPTRAEHVVRSLGDRVDLVLDGGSASVGIESTVLDLSDETPIILRPGVIDRQMLERALGVPVRHRAPGSADQRGERSPGLAERHYAPDADVWLFEPGETAEVIEALDGRVRDGARTRALVRESGAAFGRLPAVECLTMPDDPAGYARALYEALHDADAGGVTLLLVERPPESEPWTAVRDRLARAAR